MRAKNDLEYFNLVCERLPPEFELVVININTHSQKQQVRVREDFEKYSRKGFLSAVAKNPAYCRTLKNMGLNDEELGVLAYGNIPNITGTEAVYDLSIDHIVDIRLGGKNHNRNFCLIPEHVNSLKEIFITLQQRVFPEEIKTLSFSPRNNNQVPYVEGGFRVQIRELPQSIRAAENKNRINQFLGIK